MSAFEDLWSLDPRIDYLNHGAFGACPVAVLDRQAELRAHMEREPVQFLTREMQPLMDGSRAALGELLNVSPGDLALITNATAGVNTVLRSLERDWGEGDEILVTNMGYNACNNAARYVAERSGASVVEAEIKLPILHENDVLEAVGDALSERTRIAIIDHVTSGTGLIFPLEELITLVKSRDALVLIDGAHAPGMFPLDIESLGADFYTGNCHKWLCAPKGAGFLWVKPGFQDHIAPLVISHGWNTPRKGRSRFSDVMDWPGTLDPTAWACIADAIQFLSGLFPGGIEALMKRNRDVVLQGRRLLIERLGTQTVAPETMIGSLATVFLPDDPSAEPELDWASTPTPTLRMQRQLFERYAIDLPMFPLPRHPKRGFRISAQAYNEVEQYERLADALEVLLGEEES